MTLKLSVLSNTDKNTKHNAKTAYNTIFVFKQYIAAAEGGNGPLRNAPLFDMRLFLFCLASGGAADVRLNPPPRFTLVPHR